jgi:transcriptional regulator with XRE-family HTH domain
MENLTPHISINSSIRLPEFESFNFKELRKKSNLTLRQVEEYSGISNAYLSQLETGKIKSPSYQTVKKLLDIYADDFLIKKIFKELGA